MGSEQADGNPFAAVRFLESIGDTRANDPIHPAFQNRWWLPPPVWMNHDDAVRLAEFLAVLLDQRRYGAIIRHLLCREIRGKLLPRRDREKMTRCPAAHDALAAASAMA